MPTEWSPCQMQGPPTAVHPGSSWSLCSLLQFPSTVGNYGVLPHTLYFGRTHKSQTLSLVSVTHRASNFPQTFFMYQLENKFLCFEVGQHSWLNSVAHIWVLLELLSPLHCGRVFLFLPVIASLLSLLQPPLHWYSWWIIYLKPFQLSVPLFSEWLAPKDAVSYKLHYRVVSTVQCIRGVLLESIILIYSF